MTSGGDAAGASSKQAGLGGSGGGGSSGGSGTGSGSGSHSAACSGTTPPYHVPSTSKQSGQSPAKQANVLLPASPFSASSSPGPAGHAGLTGGGSPRGQQRGDSASWEHATNGVVLNIEFMSDRTTRVLLYQFRFCLVCALALLVWETIVKYYESDAELIEFDSLVTANVAVASICLAAALAVGALLLWRIWTVNRAGRVWAHLRKRTVLLFGAELAVQLINLTFFLAPNALIQAQPCSWFLTPVHVFGIIRWTCWNTLLCMFVVQAHSPLPAQLTGTALLRGALSGAFQPAVTAAHNLGVLPAVKAAQNLVARAGSVARRGLDTGWAAAAQALRHESPAAGGVPSRRSAAAAARTSEQTNGSGRGGGDPEAAQPRNSGRVELQGAMGRGREAAAAAAAAAGRAGAGSGWGRQRAAPGHADVRGALHAEHHHKQQRQQRQQQQQAGQGQGGQAELARSDDEDEPSTMVMELPFKAHYGKAVLLWLPCEIILVCFVLYIFGVFGSHNVPCASLEDTRCYPEAVNGTANCREWRYNCRAYTNSLAMTFLGLATGLCILTLLVYFVLIVYTQRELARRPYVHFRHNNVLLRTQYQTRLVAAVFFILSNTLFWYVGMHSCSSYMTTWLGLTPMQIVMTSLVVINSISILPSDPSRRQLDLHSWLQDYAWLEADLPRKLAARPVAASEPMFCVETALKLLCWSWVVYYDKEEHISTAKEASNCSTAAQGSEQAGDGHSNGRKEGGSCEARVTEQPGGSGNPQPPLSTSQRPQQEQQQQDQQQQEQQQQQDGEVKHGADAPACDAPTPELTLAVALGLYGLTEQVVLWGPQHDAKCQIGWSREEGRIVVCFRGTCSLTNMVNNMKVWRVPHPPVRGSYWLAQRPLIHRGFQQSYEANGLNVQVVETLSGILSSGPPPSGRPWRLLFTGHSLGGALASLAAFDMVRLLEQLPGRCQGRVAAAAAGPPPPPPPPQSVDISVYTFGAPRLGNHAFAREYRAAVPASFDVIHADDTVTRNGKFLVLYKRAAHPVVLSPTGDLIIRPSMIERHARESFSTSLQQHLLGAYARSFAALIRGQYNPEKEHNGGRRGCQALLQCEYVQQVLRATADMRQESMAGMAGPAGSRRRVHRGHRHPPADVHLASGQALTAQQHASAALSRVGACPPSHRAPWQVVQRAVSLPRLPPTGGASMAEGEEVSLDMGRLASM